MPEAARLGDPIAHTSALTGFLVGAVIGVALIAAVAFATFTCGFGVALLAGLMAGVGASAILGLGEAIGKMFSSPAGGITSGSPNVFINRRNAAYATASTVTCKKHNPVPMVADGSSNVFYNGKPAARKGDAVTCGAKIDDGSGNVFVGGGSVRYLPVDDEVPAWLRTAVDWAFALAGLAGGLAGLVRVAGGLSRAVLPCAAKFIGGFVIGEAVGRYVAAPVVSRVFGGQAGHPVEVATGRKILLAQDETDFVVPSPLPVVCGRFYGSDLTHEGALGRGWVLPWELRLQRRDGRLWYTDAQGRECGFPDLKPGEQSFHDAEQRYLSRTGGDRYVLQDLNETYFDFGTLGEEDGATAHLLRIEDQAGQWQAYERDAQGRVTFIRTSGGQELKLHYVHLQGRLTAITGGDGTSGGTLVAYDYDRDGQLAGVRDANGNVARRFAYENGLMASHVNALGFECRYEWAGVEGRQRVVASTTSEGERWTFDYDPAARRSTARDGLGRRAEWTYDEHFQVLACRDLDGSRYRIAYNAAGLPIALHLPGERQVNFAYDEAGRLVGETDPLGRTTTTGYAGNGLRVSEVHLPDGRRWRAEYDLQGRLLRTRDPLGRIERYEYPEDLTPWPMARVDARGGRQTMAWDRRGLLTAYTDCSGKTTRYEYDRDGYLSATVDALGQRVVYTRRRTGEPTLVTLPDGSREWVEYDAAGLVALQRNAVGDTRAWERNARGQVVKATDPAGRSLHYRYDEGGRLTGLRSDNGAAYRFEYDAADRLRTEVRPDGIERHLSYGPGGELIAVETVGTLEQRDGERPHRTAAFERDKMGRLLARATGTALTRYTWDAGDRLVQAERVPGEAGLALGIGPDTVRFEYDPAGRLIAEHGVNGSVGYELDELDNLATLHLPHGQRLDLLTYGSGHVHQVRCGEQVVSDFERDDLHREVSRTQGRLAMRTGYDALGRRQWQSAGAPDQALGPGQGRFWRSYRYHPTGELAELHDSLRGAIRYGYDPAGQLLAQTRVADGSQEQFAWDAAGNLLDEIQRKSRGQVQDNRLTVWQDLRFEYDPWGNVVAKRKGAHRRQHFRFDAEDRLVAVVTEDPRGRTETRFEYDALGRRIGRTVAQTEQRGAAPYVERRRFVWQGLRLVQEVRDSGVSSYVYSPEAAYTPLARLDAAIGQAAAAAVGKAQEQARVYHFHTDLVGAPLEVTDEAGELAWAGRYRAWGQVEHGEDQALMPRLEQPLRYPGQYADDSTGLHYNTFRYYDPEVGRFISQDPIGLLGGENLYQYAPNPNGWIDPLGWCADAAKGVGGLSDELAGTFAGGRYTSRVLKEDLIVYRAGTADRPLGQFFSKDIPISEIQTRIDKAVLPVWPGGATSPLDTAFKVRIPAGTTVHTGTVGGQSGFYVGGTQQIVVEKPWLISGVKVLGSWPLK